jgi:glycosyltransferase involved in cell wall biosynthesis
MKSKGNQLISIVTPCYNEEGNVEELAVRIHRTMAHFPDYDYEHIFIDNASTDATVAKIKALAQQDHRIKLIVNTRNFGHIRSPVHAILQARGKAVIVMASDLQDPPELIEDFLREWQAGNTIVVAVKPKSLETWPMTSIRRAYYRLIGHISDVNLIPDFTGFGLYDREVIEVIRSIGDPYPYFRGLISELGYDYASIPFEKPRRKKGVTKNNFYTLYDMAMLGITSHSKVPIRIATMLGFMLGALSLAVSVAYLILKLLFWDYFTVGTAPILISLFFFASVQLFFIGIIGEYVGSIHTHVRHRPLVVEKERVNFDFD